MMRALMLEILAIATGETSLHPRAPKPTDRERLQMIARIARRNARARK